MQIRAESAFFHTGVLQVMQGHVSLPRVVRRRTDFMLSEQFTDGPSGVCFLQDPHDLRFRTSLFLMATVLAVPPHCQKDPAADCPHLREHYLRGASDGPDAQTDLHKAS